MLEAAERQTLDGIDFGGEKTINIALPDVQIPEAAYELYHKQIGGLNRKHLRGPAYKVIRKEIAIFLKEGRASGRDGKMAYTHLMVEAVKIFEDWLNAYGGGNVTEHFGKFRDLNTRWATRAKADS